ncbi:MAG: hypothetical protein J7521_11170 [Caulobacter sp.]|nr:hypothetical protein [Caulobacter sp.]
MHLDRNRAPLVFMRPDMTTDTPYERQLDDLLDAGAPFVLVTKPFPDHVHDETPEERKVRALQFKRQRERLRSLCRGVVVIQGDKPLALPFRLAAEGFGKAVGVPVRFVRDEAEATAVGLSLAA